jgi:hypothetical protein
MRTTSRCALLLGALASLGLLGCEASVEEPPANQPQPKATEKQPEAKKVLVGNNVFLEIQGENRRVLVNATVVLQRGQLELLMCRKNTKEHEAVFAADVDARDVHKALVLAGAEPGNPVAFQPKFKPASGQTLNVFVSYDKKGKLETVNAKTLIKNTKTNKELDTDWVFAGSRLIDNPLDKDKPKVYLANDGDLICVSNFEGAMIDLPIKSSKENADLEFECFTDRIPPVDTKVTIILEPVKKK